MVTQVFLIPALSSRTNLKVHPILVTPKLVKKVIANLDSLKPSGADYLLLEVLKNCKSELYKYQLILSIRVWGNLVFPIVGESLCI